MLETSLLSCPVMWNSLLCWVLLFPKQASAPASTVCTHYTDTRQCFFWSLVYLICALVVREAALGTYCHTAQIGSPRALHGCWLLQVNSVCVQIDGLKAESKLLVCVHVYMANKADFEVSGMSTEALELAAEQKKRENTCFTKFTPQEVYTLWWLEQLMVHTLPKWKQGRTGQHTLTFAPTQVHTESSALLALNEWCSDVFLALVPTWLATQCYLSSPLIPLLAQVSFNGRSRLASCLTTSTTKTNIINTWEINSQLLINVSHSLRKLPLTCQFDILEHRII